MSQDVENDNIELMDMEDSQDEDDGRNESETPSKRPKRGAKCWEFFVEVEGDKAKCNLCEKIYSYTGTTSGLNKHLKNDHPEEYGENIAPSLVEKKVKKVEKIAKKKEEAKVLGVPKISGFFKIQPYSMSNKSEKKRIKDVRSALADFTIRSNGAFSQTE